MRGQIHFSDDALQSRVFNAGLFSLVMCPIKSNFIICFHIEDYREVRLLSNVNVKHY